MSLLLLFRPSAGVVQPDPDTVAIRASAREHSRATVVERGRGTVKEHSRATAKE